MDLSVMRRRPSSTARAACFAGMLAATSIAAEARAQDPAAPPPAATPEALEAQQRFQRAKQLYEEGDFALALVEFRRAYEVSPNYRVLFNIGQVNIQLFNYAAARVALEKYLEDGKDDISPTRRAQVEADLKMLAGRTAYLNVVSTPAGADVTIDDVSVGKAPFSEPLLVNAGQRKVVVSRAGFVVQTRVVTLGGGDRGDVTVELVPVPTEKPVIVAPRTESKPNYTPAAIGWISAGGLTVATAIVGGLYLSKEAEIRRLNDPANPVEQQTALDAESSATRLAVAADVLGILALAAGGISLYLTLKPPRTEVAAPPSTALVRVSPTGIFGTF